MDVDLLNSSSTSSLVADHNLDMMTMMMQIEKPLEFYDHYFPNTPTYQQINFSGKTNSTTNNLTNSATLPIFHNPNVALVSSSSPQFMNPSSSSVSFVKNRDAMCSYENKNSSMVAMREMIFRIASMQPIHIDPESIKPPKRKNVKISKDPQSIAARHRRERISERIRILQRLVPGGTKMDTASMLDEAIHYVKFLKKQVQNLEQAGATSIGFTGTQLGT